MLPFPSAPSRLLIALGVLASSCAATAPETRVVLNGTIAFAEVSAWPRTDQSGTFRLKYRTEAGVVGRVGVEFHEGRWSVPVPADSLVEFSDLVANGQPAEFEVLPRLPATAEPLLLLGFRERRGIRSRIYCAVPDFEQLDTLDVVALCPPRTTAHAAAQR